MYLKFKIYVDKLLSFLKYNNKYDDNLFCIDQIEYYHRNKKRLPDYAIIDDKTINDVDFHELFKYIDKTNSKVGQQYFWDKLVSLNLNINFDDQEKWIVYFDQEKENATKIKNMLSKLKKYDAYNISKLFIDEYIQKPKWHSFIKVLSFIPILSLLLMHTFSTFFYVLIISLLTNFVIHYFYKRYIHLYMNSIPQLLILLNTIKRIVSLNLPIKPSDSILFSIKSFDKIKGKMSVFELDKKNYSDLAIIIFALLEYCKIFFLIEPIIIFDILNKLDCKRNDIQNIFEYVGEIDSFLSINDLRKGMTNYCCPVINNNIHYLEFQDIYHPLVINCIPNSLKIKGKSVLLTGSNMAGKTTFIRTVAINVILAQTINTCFAKEFKLRTMNLFSAIRIFDDLLDDKSYYFEEVVTVKNMIEQSNMLSNNLFLLDEIFRGTNTLERIAAGKAVLSYLVRSDNNIVFVSTHDIELAELLNDDYDLYHFTEIIKNGELHFDYKIKEGRLTTSNAIRILELNNYPKEIINDANAFISSHQQK